MNRFQRVISTVLLGAALSASWGCSPASRERTRTEYAYVLLDEGRNSEAVLLLEEELEANPGNDEARTLLGSALAGMAGINIYSIFEHFSDLLFKHSLKDTVLDPKDLSAELKEKKRALRRELSDQLPQNSPALNFIHKLDSMFTEMQGIAVYLNRFPQIDRNHWVLLETALTELNRVRPSRDLCVYRILLRLIYLRTYLVEEVLRDPAFGTREWICRFRMSELKPVSHFLNEQVEKIFADLDLAVSLGAKKLVKARNGLSFLADASLALAEGIALEGSPSYTQIETLVRLQAGCGP